MEEVDCLLTLAPLVAKVTKVDSQTPEQSTHLETNRNESTHQIRQKNEKQKENKKEEKKTQHAHVMQNFKDESTVKNEAFISNHTIKWEWTRCLKHHTKI